jgi:hypothetical protein
MRNILRTKSNYALLALGLAFILSSCASNTYLPVDVNSSGFLERTQQQQSDGIIVSAAAPDAQETAQLTGLDLYDQGIQPIWLRIENTTAHRIRLATWSIDRDYFSPIEVAYTNRSGFTKPAYSELERWFNANSMVRHIPAGESRSGLIYTNLKPGTKGFNLDIIGNQTATTFTFFLPMPGFVPDYMHVDFEKLYPSEQRKELSVAGLRTELQKEFYCCSEDQAGNKNGAPLNIILVGTGKALRRSLLRGNWLETDIDTKTPELAQLHRFDGRPPDGTFYQDRADGDERLQLDIWLTSLQVDATPVWAVQAYYRDLEHSFFGSLQALEPARDSGFLQRFVTDSVSADIDSARTFTAQNFSYNNSLKKLGFVAGEGPKTVAQPGTTFDGYGFVTDGFRAVLFLSEEAQAYDDIEIIYPQLMEQPDPGDDRE